MLLFYIGHDLHNSVLTGAAAAVSIGFIVWGGIRKVRGTANVKPQRFSARHKKRGPAETGLSASE
jgi:hypothetical protein